MFCLTKAFFGRKLSELRGMLAAQREKFGKRRILLRAEEWISGSFTSFHQALK